MAYIGSYDYLPFRLSQKAQITSQALAEKNVVNSELSHKMLEICIDRGDMIKMFYNLYKNQPSKQALS
jgi:hypothetical protein